MCLHPLSIRNPTKSVNIDGGQLLRMQVPCGHCAQCLQSKRNEWYIRCHYEIKRTHAKGGYVYFDTLTYNDENLPKLSHFIDIEKYGLKDFSCFNHDHFKKFLKRLRRMIAYHYGIKKDCFRYFLTTEYGENELYTHRPHIHILFYVYGPILPLKFSELVAKCWQYGRTDGFPYKPASYVAEHTYERGTQHKVSEKVAMYVSKYITKNSGFVKTLNARLAELREKLTVYDKLHNSQVSDDSIELLKTLKRNIDMFHRQSQGFGLSYLDNITQEKWMFINEDKVIMQDSKNIVKTFPLPMYFKRKLFYNLKKHGDGSRYWELSNTGLNHVLNSKLAKVDKIVLKYMDIVTNCSKDNLVSQFFTYLGGRDISDYVVYEQFYKGRHRYNNGIDYKNNTQKPLIDEEINLEDWLHVLRLGMRPYAVDSNSIQRDEEILRTPILTPAQREQYEIEILKHGHSPELLGNSRAVNYNDYINRSVFNENTDIIFKDYDKIGILIELMSEEQRNDQQLTFEYLEDLRARYKQLFNKKL